MFVDEVLGGLMKLAETIGERQELRHPRHKTSLFFRGIDISSPSVKRTPRMEVARLEGHVTVIISSTTVTTGETIRLENQFEGKTCTTGAADDHGAAVDQAFLFAFSFGPSFSVSFWSTYYASQHLLQMIRDTDSLLGSSWL
jgi:hypothetical protein